MLRRAKLAVSPLVLLSAVLLLVSAASSLSNLLGKPLRIYNSDLCGTGNITIIVQNTFGKDVEIYNGQAALLGVARVEDLQDIIELPRIPGVPGSSPRVRVPNEDALELTVAVPKFNLVGDPVRPGEYVAMIEVLAENGSIILSTEQFTISGC